VSKKSKLIERMKARPRNFTWDEACSLMKSCGFEISSGSGSRRMFRHSITGQRVHIHKPHPENTLKRYVLDELIETLTDAGEI
jgi:predicted RNA binding protein YcfA (HicA-like mRNA interferase family)